MQVHEIAIAKTLVVHAAPEYVWDYLHRLTTQKRRSVLTEEICASIEARNHPILDLVLAAYGPSAACERMIRKSDALATVAMGSQDVNAYSIDRIFVELPKEAQVAVGQNPAFGPVGFYKKIIDVRTGHAFDPQMVENVLHGLMDNPWVKAGGHTTKTNLEGETFERIDFNDFIWSVIGDLRHGKRATERARFYAAILDAAPSAYVRPDKMSDVGLMLEEIAGNISDHASASSRPEVRDEALEAVSAALARDSAGSPALVNLLMSHPKGSVRSGFYRGVRQITKSNVRDWNKKDGALFIESVFRNPALYKLDLSDAQDFVEDRLNAIDPLLADSFRHVAEIHRNDPGGYKNGYVPVFERGRPETVSVGTANRQSN